MTTDTYNRKAADGATSVAKRPKLKTQVDRVQRLSTRAEVERVTEAVERICSMLQPNDRVPKHTDLMRQLNASARVVLDVLDNMHRSGRIVRRHGAGTFIPPAVDSARAIGSSFRASTTEPHTVVVIAPPDNSFFAYFGELMFSRCEARGLKVEYHPTRPASNSSYAHATQDCGEVYLCLATSLVPLAEQLAESGHRVAAIADPGLLGRPTSVPCVHADNAHGGYLAAKHLIELGHRRIVYAMVEGRYAIHPRWEGFTLAIADAVRAGIDVQAGVLLDSTVKQWISEPKLAEEYFANPDHPTGFCAWNDRDAMKLIYLLANAGVSVPGDVSVVGYDNLPDSSLMSPALTTVDQGVDQQIRFALQLLTQPSPPLASHTTVVSPTLIARDSSAVINVRFQNGDYHDTNK